MGDASGNGAAAELARFVGLNEGIKEVVLLAFHINLMALNAILLAHRAGELARGFSVISKELRMLAVELTKRMDRVSTEAAGMVGLISRLLSQERRQRLLRLTQERMARPLPRLEAVLGQHQDEHDRLMRRVAEARASMLEALEETRVLCQFGTALARSAKIEAAYGQSFQAALGEVSREFDDKTQCILPAIDSLCMGMKNR
ncbi:methyl-accepting chemotaxis protein [Chromobacterium sp. IIBBL 290-4]|uniref:methyl-accepting chemotaxis protein n=1 Tax=Chromobacterium sp. IIBBL 290-4 TaxID=2953890 RepID=UPI0020B65FE8|nr:methyl-accepting chemotaxis protein [Chromobacterium sp. IIBBL 290-4]UTH75533.1 methyl-accepting chemotaxis protein [Chromobacterium sp. IIBBL 290-4]